jgi:transcriptional regulator with XRE-family HTH domain
MSPEELRILRRRLGLTQAQFAERWGVSTSFVTSIELGRCRFTERRQREVARIFRDLVHRSARGWRWFGFPARYGLGMGLDRAPASLGEHPSGAAK